jgi:hypothetical protein
MGAALTYARRYALFTLVGIAGEDSRRRQTRLQEVLQLSHVDTMGDSTLVDSECSCAARAGFATASDCGCGAVL